MRFSRTGLLSSLLLLAAAIMMEPRAASASTCGSQPGDEDAVAALIAEARTACPCDAFDRPAGFRRCVLERSRAAVAAGALPARCRARVMQMANRTTCGNVSSAVTCCAPLSYQIQACRIARSETTCGRWRGNAGRPGKSDWCHDACPPAATPRPATPTPAVTETPSGPTTVTPSTPTPTPNGRGPRCVCTCGPPEPMRTPSAGCPGLHACIVTTFVPTGSADCDALDDLPRRQCTYDPNAPIPDPVHGPYIDDCEPF
jgi:hypothetical protein